MQDGQHFYLDKDEKLTDEELKLLKTQNIKYITMKLQTEKNKVARPESTLHRISSKPKEGVRNKHILFVDSDEEMEEVIANYSNERDLPKHQQAEESKEEIKKIQSTQYKELKQRRHRQRQLAMIAAKMQTKKNLQDKRPHKKIRGKEGQPVTYR